MNVELIEATPSPEETICRAARNDYSADVVHGRPFEDVMKPVDGDTLEEKQRTLIGHLLQHGHFGPLEHVTATFSLESVSRACMAQLTRHRHATFDVTSQRYVKFDEMDAGDAVVRIPELDDPGTPGRNAEFDGDYADAGDERILELRRSAYADAVEQSFEKYRDLLALGVAPENARMVLPIGTTVDIVMTLNLRMILHIGDMRAAADAQSGARQAAEGVLDAAADWAPIVLEYYEENMKGRKNRLAP